MNAYRYKHMFKFEEPPCWICGVLRSLNSAMEKAELFLQRINLVIKLLKSILKKIDPEIK